jgi:hypothetical protein
MVVWIWLPIVSRAAIIAVWDTAINRVAVATNAARDTATTAPCACYFAHTHTT